MYYIYIELPATYVCANSCTMYATCLMRTNFQFHMNWRKFAHGFVASSYRMVYHHSYTYQIRRMSFLCTFGYSVHRVESTDIFVVWRIVVEMYLNYVFCMAVLFNFYGHIYMYFYRIFRVTNEILNFAQLSKYIEMERLRKTY